MLKIRIRYLFLIAIVLVTIYGYLYYMILLPIAKANVAPTQPNVTLAILSAPSTDLIATASGSTDADGDFISYKYIWSKDSVIQPSLENQYRVPVNYPLLQGQVWQVTVTPTDGIEDGPSKTVSLTLSNIAPYFESREGWTRDGDLRTIYIYADEQSVINIKALDPEGENITYTDPTPPTGAVIDPVDRTLTWTPTSADIGTSFDYNLTFQASDGVKTTTATLTLRVLPQTSIGDELFKDETFDHGIDLWTVGTGATIYDDRTSPDPGLPNVVFDLQEDNQELISQEINFTRQDLSGIPFTMLIHAKAELSDTIYAKVSWQGGQKTWQLTGKGYAPGYNVPPDTYTFGENQNEEGPYFTLPQGVASPLTVSFGATAGTRLTLTSLKQYYGKPSNKMYMKLTALADMSAPIWFKHKLNVIEGENLVGLGVNNPAPKLVPGSSTDWIDISSYYLSPGGNNGVFLNGTSFIDDLYACSDIVYISGGGYDYYYPENVSVKVEFSLTPDGSKKVKEFTYTGKSPNIQFTIPNPPSELSLTKRASGCFTGIMSEGEKLAQLLNRITNDPYTQDQPQKFYTDLSYAPYGKTTNAYDEQKLALLKAMGGNQWKPGYESDGFIYNDTSHNDLEVGRADFKVVDGQYIDATSSDSGTNVFRRCTLYKKIKMQRPETLTTIQDFINNLPGALESYYRFWLGDENLGVGLEHMFDCPICQAGFKTFLQERFPSVTPQDLGFNSWDEVTPAVPDNPERKVDSSRDLVVPATWNNVKANQPYLWYLTNEFSDYTLEEASSTAKDVLTQAGGGQMRTNISHSDASAIFMKYETSGIRRSINLFNLTRYGDHSLMPIGMWVGSQYSSNPTLEDVGMYYDIERSACRRGNNDCMVGVDLPRKRTPFDERAALYEGLGRDSKHFMLWDEAFWWGSCGPEDIYYEAGRVFNEIGQVEDLLHPMKRKRAEVAVVYARSNEVWEDWGQALFTRERYGVHYALNHEQFNADVITEEDIEEDILASGYKAVYVIGGHLRHAAAEKIRTFVNNGGVVYGFAQAGRYDEKNQPTDIMNEVFGAAVTNVNKISTCQPYAFHQSNCPAVTQNLTIKTGTTYENLLNDAKTSLVGVLVKDALNIQSDDVEVLATFADETPALIYHPYGQGKAFYAGTLVGAEYHHKALDKFDNVINGQPERSHNYPHLKSPYWFPSGERAMVNLAAKVANAERPVTADKTQIVTSLMKKDMASIAVIINYLIDPQQNVNFTIDHSTASISSVRSLEQGNLSYTQLPDGDVQVSLPIGMTDMIIIEDGSVAPNNPPTQPGVSIDPSYPNTNDNLTCNATGSTDPDGDAITYKYSWYKNNILQPDLTDKTVDNSKTTETEIWRCVVTPNDGKDDGPSGSDEVTISGTISIPGDREDGQAAPTPLSKGNTPPTQPNVSIDPRQPNTTDNLTCNASGSTDPDGDSITYKYTWYKDNDLQLDLISSAVDNSKTTEGEIWLCVVTPNDGKDDGPSASDEVTIRAASIFDLIQDNIIKQGKKIVQRRVSFWFWIIAPIILAISLVFIVSFIRRRKSK